MKYFADTYYFLALLNPNDRSFSKALALSPSTNDLLFTTEWVLIELGDGLSSARNKQIFVRLHDRLRIRANVRIIPADDALFGKAVGLYRNRLDKDWSLTDCASFVAMQENGIAQALTADHHFEQAGFVALLK